MKDRATNPGRMTYSIKNQAEFSSHTFGPGARTSGVIDHIAKELEEIKTASIHERMEEWIDVVILAIDGAWRHAHYERGIPLSEIDEYISVALQLKCRKNKTRE